jgi:cytoskeletal protein CcmA (bactofilin family)
MFERNKKDSDSVESQDTNRPDSGRTFGALKSKVTGGDSAVIGRSIQINGDLRGDEDLRIEGDVNGTVELKNNSLTIGKEGRVKADVYARSIAVDGETKGDLYATERISIHVNARVQGNVISPRVSIEEGAHFKGSIEMNPAAVEKVLGKSAASAGGTAGAEKRSGDAGNTRAAPKSAAKGTSSNLNPPTGAA